MQDTLTRPLNLQDEVTPNHWSVDRFEKFSRMTVDEEFDAIAPLFVYFDADSSRDAAARAGADKLKAVGHPLLSGISANDVMDVTRTPDGLRERYTALLWAIADEVIPGCEAYVDEYGAYSFRIQGDTTLLSGDASGTFAYYADAKALRKRLAMALETTF